MWRSVGEDKIKKMEGKKIDEVGSIGSSVSFLLLTLQEPNGKKRRGYLRVDCQSASKGLFLVRKNFLLQCRREFGNHVVTTNSKLKH